VTASTHPFGDTLDCKIRRGQPEVDEMNGVTGRRELPEPRRKRPAREHCLKCEIDALGGKLADAGEHHATSRDRGALRIECRQAAGDHICVDELVDRQRAMQERRRDGRLPGAVWSGQNDNARARLAHVKPTLSALRLRVSSAAFLPTVCSAVP
jgi:hypothetical protein